MGLKSAAGARGAAAGHGRGRAPRLLRLGVIGRWPPPPHRSPRPPPARARSPSSASPPATRRGRSPRCDRAPRTPRCTRSPTRSRRARRRSSRPTRATWRPGARAGSTPRCSTASRSTRSASRAIAAGVRAIAALPDPVGEVIDGWRLPNGLDVRKVRVPLGVVAVVYEARPNVTIDAAALCLKSGNAIVLRGSSSAAHSNAVLAAVAAQAAAERRRCPRARSSLVAGGGREELAELATQDGVVDLIIPRGGEGLKTALKGVATVPVIYAASGNCHVYVDASADLDAARAHRRSTPRPSGPASATRPRRCSSTPTSRRAFLPRVLRRAARGRRRAARRRAHARAGRRGAGRRRWSTPTDEDWDTEFLALVLAVGVVDSRRRGDRARQRPRLRPLRGDRHRRRERRRAPSSAASTRRASTSTRRRASPTAASSAWAPRSATRPRSCTRAARSGCASCAPSSTWSTATATCGLRRSGAALTGPRVGHIGILGGTFNPPHIGHLVCAQEALDQLGLDRVLLMPVGVPPHKEAREDPAPRRGSSCAALAVAGDERFDVSDARGRARRRVVHGRYPEGAA